VSAAQVEEEGFGAAVVGEDGGEDFGGVGGPEGCVAGCAEGCFSRGGQRGIGGGGTWRAYAKVVML